MIKWELDLDVIDCGFWGGIGKVQYLGRYLGMFMGGVNGVMVCGRFTRDGMD